MTFDHKINRVSIPNLMKIKDNLFTEKQGQYLAYIHYYTKINEQPPAEADMQKYFNVTAPSVHRMIVELEKKGLIHREKRKARSLSVRLNLNQLPQLI